MMTVLARRGRYQYRYPIFGRWADQRMWAAILETLADLCLADNWQHMIDSTTVQGQSRAAGAKAGSKGRL